MLIRLAVGVVVLGQDGDDPTGDIIEVYDNPQPPSRRERVLAVEALASRPWIVVAEVGACDGREDRLDMIEQPRAAALGQV